MRRFLPALLLAVAVAVPFSILGCDLSKLKGGGADAAGLLDASITIALGVDAATAAMTPDAEAAATSTLTPPIVPTPTTTVHALVDAGKPVDAGKAAPVPTPFPQIPGLDAGGLRLPDGGRLQLPHF